MDHSADPLPSDAVSSDEIPGAYYSARVPQTNEDRVLEINPTLSWMEKRRQLGGTGSSSPSRRTGGQPDVHKARS